MMQNAIKITDSIYWIGGNDRETDLFEGLWTLPRGVAYNAYFINDEKTAVIDTIKADKLSDYIERLVSILPAGKGIDYLIVNHMEPDHSGSISIMRKLYPEMKIIGNKKTLEMIEAFYGIHDGVVEVKEGEILDLGRHKLAFATIPMVHWPESMVTYDTTDKVLFSTDAFGGFCALEGGIFDDELDIFVQSVYALGRVNSDTTTIVLATVPTGINDVAQDAADGKVSVSSSAITVDGVAQSIAVFNAAGALQLSCKNASRADISALQGGVYVAIVTVDGKSVAVKFTK